MTVIIGIVEDGKCYVGSDTQVSTGDIINPTKLNKIMKIGNVVLGVAGGYHVISSIKGSKKTFPKYDGGDYYYYLLKKLVPYIQKLIEEINVEYDSTILVGIKDRLFILHSDFSITEPTDNFWAIGSGQGIALGILYNKIKRASAPELISEIVSVCGKLLTSCNSECDIRNTDE